MNKFQLAGVSVAAILVASSGALAAVASLQDGNSAVQFNTNDTSTRTGMTGWQVDGTEQLWNQWFWYRVGDTGANHRFNTVTDSTLTELGSGVTDTNFDGNADHFSILYGSTNGFRALMTFGLQGGSTGSNRSDMSEQIRISNTGTSPLSFHFFQYCDFDLAGTINDSSVSIVPNAANNQIVDQADGAFHTSETVVTPQPSHHEVGVYPSTITSLDGASPTTLNDSNTLSGPADYTWAFQWDFTLNPGDSYLISKDKSITPAPGAFTVLGLGGLAIARRRRR